VNFAPKAVIAQSTTFRLYSGAAYVRVDASVNGTEKGYYSANCGGWGAQSNDTYTPTQKAWYFETSTAGISDDLYVCFCTTSSQSGPGPFSIEWAAAEAGPWTFVTDYKAGNWEVIPGPKNFAFKLPDGCKNQSSLWLRFRVNSDERVDGKAANSATGTNRMIYTSLKKKVN